MSVIIFHVPVKVDPPQHLYADEPYLDPVIPKINESTALATHMADVIPVKLFIDAMAIS
jgi:hypothetical protein